MTLEAHYPLTEDTGNVALDYSGNGNDGSITGAGPAGTGTVTGPFGNSAYDFDGNNDNVQLDSSPNVDDSSGLTVSGWMNVENTDDGRTLLSVDFNDTHWVLRPVTTGEIQFFYRSTSGDEALQPSTTISTNTFFHVTGTYDGSTMRLYLDGREIGSFSPSNALDQKESHNRIGERFGGTDYMFGQIADARIYDRTLSPQEVQALYQAGERSEAVFAVTDSTATSQSVSGGGGGGSTGGGGGGTTY